MSRHIRAGFEKLLLEIQLLHIFEALKLTEVQATPAHFATVEADASTNVIPNSTC